MEVVTKSAQETQALGEKIANKLIIGHQPSIIALTGELGSGKTTFLQGLAKGLGIKERILSPTFIMMRDYQVRSAKCKAQRFYHVDLYRLESEKDIEGLGLKEIWSDPKNIIAIEWVEKIKNVLPKKRMDIFFEYLEENERRITVNSKP
jgi:tRNA threonylcarbamoyladenosine biosynthesis protein TsaE